MTRVTVHFRGAAPEDGKRLVVDLEVMPEMSGISAMVLTGTNGTLHWINMTHVAWIDLEERP